MANDTARRMVISVLPPFLRGRGYTLIEIMVVAAISLLLLSIVAVIYNGALKIYEESQGLSLVYETSRLINSDIRNTFGYVVPVPGNWIDPKTYNFPGQPGMPADIDSWYLNAGSTGNLPPKTGPNGWMENENPLIGANKLLLDQMFSYAQYDQCSGSLMNSTGMGRVAAGNMPYNMSDWSNIKQYGSLRGWWMPAFFGKRTPIVVNPPNYIMQSKDVNAGSWGWPRADYRMNIDIDNGSGNYVYKQQPGDTFPAPATPVICCWFYAENRTFNSPRTMALDNSNIVLVSMKFSYNQAVPNPLPPLHPTPETTQLSFLRHAIVGFDLPSQGLLRSDETTGSMLRAIRITPYYFDSAANGLIPMGDRELNSTLMNGASVTGSIVQQPPSSLPLSDPGFKVPRAFDVEYVLRNPYTFTRYTFALRVYCQIDPLALPVN